MTALNLASYSRNCRLLGVKLKLPTPSPILSYKEIFGEPPPRDFIGLVQHISRQELIANFASSNNRLKPPEKVYYDTSIARQWDELRLFCGQNQLLFKFYQSRILSFVPQGTRWTIFNRVSNLHAAELIISAQGLNDANDFTMKVKDWDNLVKFYLCINVEVFQDTELEDKNEKLEFLEFYSSKFVSSNQYSIETNPIYTLYRAGRFFKFIDQSSRYKNSITNYFKEGLKCTPEYFLNQIFSLISFKKNDIPLLKFVYHVVDEEARRIFDFLSVPRSKIGTRKLEFLSIKKKPFYKNTESLYSLLDSQFLIEKTYDLFVNDLWFDYLSRDLNAVEERTRALNIYRTTVGYFFESYIREILTIALDKYRYPPLKCFDDLKSSKDGIELADIYLRHNKKILLGEAKSGAINAQQMYSNYSDEFYKNNIDKFYDDFGLNQLTKYLVRLRDRGREFDDKFPDGKIVQVFPILLFAERSLRSGLFAESFAERFKKMYDPKDYPRFDIRPLCMIHIEEFEYVCGYLQQRGSKDLDLFDLIRLNHNGLVYPQSFTTTLNKLRIPFKVPAPIKEFFIGLQKVIERERNDVSSVSFEVQD